MRPTLPRLAQIFPSSKASPSAAKPKPKTTASRPSRLRTQPPSLEHFIQRQRVIALYRTILRSLFRIPKTKRSEPIAYARDEFVRNKGVSDIGQIRYLISTGKTEFDSMQRYVDELAVM